MNQLRKALKTPWGGRAVSEPVAPSAHDGGHRHRPRTLTTAAVASTFALLTIAAPAHADSAEVLRTGNGRLLSHGTVVQIRVTYHCAEGRNAGVGIFLSQAGRHGPAAFGGAGSGQRPCTGGTETVTLTIPAGSGHFSPGSASAAVSLFTSGPGTADETEQSTENIRLVHRP